MRAGDGAMLRVVDDAANLAKNSGVGSGRDEEQGQKQQRECELSHDGSLVMVSDGVGFDGADALREADGLWGG